MFKAIDQKSVVQAIQEQIRSLIREGRLAPGSKLPSEKDLMEQLSVSRPTLREALHMMVGEGLLEVRPGRGTFVREPTSAAAIQTEVVSLLLASEDIEEIQEVRKILEPEVAARVAQRATDEDFDDLATILEEMAAAVDAGASPFETAWAFHRRLPQAAGNAAMAKIVDIIYEMIRTSEQPLYDRYFNPQQELHDHQELVEVLKRRDPKQARAAMIAHLKDVDEHLTAGLAAEQRTTDSPPPKPSV
jgi:GntR family transcriptional repressor for pyruvate dehydrogenase complex